MQAETQATLSVLRRVRGGAVGLAALACLAPVAAFAPAVRAAAPPVVKLTQAQEQALGVRTAALVAADAAPLATLPAVFVRPPSGRSAVSAPFAGTVTEVAVIEGQAVRAGQTLAVVFSRDALAETAALRQARAEAALAAAAAQRTRRLVEEGVVAGARAAEADARAQAAQAMLDAKSMSVRSAGVGGSGRFVLKAPFAGRVADVAVTAGQGIDAMATAFVVDRENRIQVDAVMPAALAGRVQPGARAVVEGVEGKVVAVGAEIDPKTRSLSVRAEAPPRPAFIPGRSTRLTLYGSSAAGLSAPRAAVTQVGGRDSVFVKGAAGYIATPVQVLGYSGDKVIVSGALKPGAPVAAAGVSELKAKAES